MNNLDYYSEDGARTALAMLLLLGCDTVSPAEAAAAAEALASRKAAPPARSVPSITAPPRPAPVAKTLPSVQAAPTGPHPAEACQSLAELDAAVAAFEGCSLKLLAKNTVFIDGNPRAQVLLIGEAPGAEEDGQGRPFVGPAGQLLNVMLSFIGLSPHAIEPEKAVLISNTVFWRPPGNRKPGPDELALCRPFTEKLIALHRPRVLVACGGTAAAVLTGSTNGIMALRGNRISLTIGGHNVVCLPMLHPSYLLRVPTAKKIAWQDCLTLANMLK